MDGSLAWLFWLMGMFWASASNKFFLTKPIAERPKRKSFHQTQGRFDCLFEIPPWYIYRRKGAEDVLAYSSIDSEENYSNQKVARGIGEKLRCAP